MQRVVGLMRQLKQGNAARPLVISALVLLLSLALSACGQPTFAQLEATATVQGCWPYGYNQPRATRTPQPTGTPRAGTPTATIDLTPSSTPRPTWIACTPAPQTPTLTPTNTLTPTPWTRPTERPVLDRTSKIVNLSNMAGLDREPVVAVHPTEGWAATLWVNNPPSNESEDNAIFVRVQDPRTHDWKPGISVNTLASYAFASGPDLTIDQAGRIHVVFGQAEYAGSTETLFPHYTYSDDAGDTWSQPEALPYPGGTEGRGAVDMEVAVDPAGQVHVTFGVTPCFDCFYHVHLARPANAPAGTSWEVTYPPEARSESNHQRGRLAFVTLPDGRVRTFFGASCFRGCGAKIIRIFTRDEPGGSWGEVPIPGIASTHSDQHPFSLDALAFIDRGGLTWVCFAWGDYWRSGVYSSCSNDYGASWQQPQTIIYTEEPDIPPEPTSDPAVTPTTGPNVQFDSIDRGYAPALLYDASTDKLMAIWILRQGGAPNPKYLVYSYKRPGDAAWTPYLNGPHSSHDPKLRLFTQETRRNQASGWPSVAYTGSGLAYVIWLEIEHDENIEIYFGIFNPGAMLAEVSQ